MPCSEIQFNHFKIVNNMEDYHDNPNNKITPKPLGIEEKSDIEKEIGNENIKIEIPFNPDDINIKIVPRNIGQLVELLEDDQILIPKYQRLPHLWTDTQKSRFIESLMLDLPIPLFYFDEAEDKKWSVIDGLQRISTLEHFILGSDSGKTGGNTTKLKLQNLEFLTNYNGYTWGDLPKEIRRRISTNQVTINLIGKGTPSEVKYTIFSRINQGGIPLTPQEIRTALFQGFRVDFLEVLVSKDTEIGKLFHQVTDGSVKSRRQEDLDFVSRFLAFYLQDFSQYEPDMDRFISLGTKLIPSEQNKQQEIIDALHKALSIAWEIFGTDAFRKRVSINDSRNPINKSMFEVIAIAFTQLTPTQKDSLIANKVEFRNAFIGFQQTNEKFWNAITTSTASKESVSSRHKEFATFLTNFLNDNKSQIN